MSETEEANKLDSAGMHVADLSSSNNLPAKIEFEAVVAQDPALQARVVEIRRSIDLSDSNAVLNFGTSLQSRIADFADSILSEVRSKDSGPVGDLLTDLLVGVRGLDTGSLGVAPGFLAQLPIIGRFFDHMKRFIARYETLSVQVERVVDRLSDAKQGLLRDVTRLDGLFDRNVDYFKDLEIYIQAGEGFANDARSQLLPNLQAELAKSSDPLAGQRFRDFEQALNRFDKRLYDLKLSKTIALQTLPQIRLVQAANQELSEKIQSSILNTIPLWKNQIVLAVTLVRQRGSLQLQRNVTDATNKLLTQNAAMMKTGATEIAAESERGIVDIETLKKVNEDLISTVEDVLKIQQEGRDKRAAAETELLKIESELKAKIGKA